MTAHVLFPPEQACVKGPHSLLGCTFLSADLADERSRESVRGGEERLEEAGWPVASVGLRIQDKNSTLPPFESFSLNSS